MARCSELTPGDQVVYKLTEDGKTRYEEGTVSVVVPEAKTVHTSRLEGYKNRDDAVPFTNMIAKYDPDGEYMRFDNIHGPSVLLDPE